MWRDQHVGQRPEGMAARKGLCLEDVERCLADLPAAQRLQQRGLLHHRTAADIDQLRAPRQRSELRRADQAPRRAGQRQHHHEDLDLAQELRERSRPAGNAWQLARAARPAAHIVAHLRQQPRRRRAELPQAQHAYADLRQRARVDVVPLSPALRRLEGRDVAGVARDGEGDIGRHQTHHARIVQPRDGHGRQVVPPQQAVHPGPQIHHQPQSRHAAEEARRRLPDKRHIHLRRVARGRAGAEVQPRQVPRQRRLPGDGIVQIRVESQDRHAASSP